MTENTKYAILEEKIRNLEDEIMNLKNEFKDEKVKTSERFKELQDQYINLLVKFAEVKTEVLAGNRMTNEMFDYIKSNNDKVLDSHLQESKKDGNFTRSAAVKFVAYISGIGTFISAIVLGVLKFLGVI